MANKEETMQEKREAHQLAKQMFSTDTGSLEEKLLRIGSGEKVEMSELNPSSGGGTGLIDTSADHPEASAEHIDYDTMFTKMGYKPSESKNIMSKSASAPVQSMPYIADTVIAGIVTDIGTFKFSSANKDEEVAMLREALRKEMKNIISRRIIKNTKQVSSGVHEFYRIKDGSHGGMRVEFSILNHKFSMSAMGEFCGNECLCWQASGDTVEGHVMRVGDDGFENVTDKFKVTMTEGWKE